MRGIHGTTARTQLVLRRGTALAALAAAGVLAAACGSPGSPGGSTASSGGGAHAAAAKGGVSTRRLSGVGTVLVDSSGRTVYTPKQPSEANGHIKCTGACLTFWFPVTAGSASHDPGGLPGRLGTIQRPGGQAQVTYDGRPLYTFRLDTAAGQAHGNNFHDHFGATSFTWQAVTASGMAAGAGSPAPSASHSPQPGY